jgi:hypothetical protein
VALSVSLVASVAGSGVTGSFTPANNSLLIAFGLIGDNGTASISGGSLAWTQQKLAASTGGFTAQAVCWTAPVTTGVSMTVGVSSTGGGKQNCAVYQATGHDTTTPIGVTGSSVVNAGGSTNALSYSLSGAPASSSYVLSGFSTQTNNDVATGCSAGAGFTLDTPSNFETASWTAGVEHVTGTTSTTVSWTDVAIGDSAYTLGAVAVEVRAAGGSETITMDKWWQPPFYRSLKTEMVGY